MSLIRKVEDPIIMKVKPFIIPPRAQGCSYKVLFVFFFLARGRVNLARKKDLREGCVSNDI